MPKLTADGVPIKSGMMVYYLASILKDETVRSHPVMTTPNGLSSENIKALKGRVFSLEANATKFKDYIKHARTRKFTSGRVLAIGYNPRAEAK